MMKEKTANLMGYFDRLPKELLLIIFKKISNLKVLCRCLLVSKQFASIIYTVETVSLSLPNSNNLLFNEKLDVFRNVLYSNAEEFPRLIQSSFIQELNFCTTLQNFKELKSIHVELIIYPSKSCCSFTKWKANSRSRYGTLVESFITLYAGSMIKKAKQGSNECSVQLHEKPCAVFTNHLLYKKCILLLCLLIIKCHIPLKSVTIVDSHKHGKFVLGGEQLVSWRKNLFCHNFLNKAIPKHIFSASVNDLHLPISGDHMKSVVVTMYGFSDSEYDDPTSWEYDDEEKVLGEAVKVILKEHRNEILFQ